MLTIDSINTYYGESHILQNLTMTVGTGETVCVFGRNGAGKTTTMRSIVGFTRPRSGSIRFDGAEIVGRPTHVITRSGIALVPQGRRLFPTLTVTENLLLGARPKDGPWTLQRVYDLFPRLAERFKHRGDQLSGGEQQMVAIGRALLMNPRLLLLDEPSEGLAPIVVGAVTRALGRIASEEGLSVLLVEQNLTMGLSIADRCYVMSKGTTVFECAPEVLANDPELKQMYLGV